jgi:hypothetical protein
MGTMADDYGVLRHVIVLEAHLRGVFQRVSEAWSRDCGVLRQATGLEQDDYGVFGRVTGLEQGDYGGVQRVIRTEWEFLKWFYSRLAV